MQSSKEEQGEIRKPSSVINVKNRGKQQNGKTRDLFKKIKTNQGNISCNNGHNKGQKWYGPKRSRRYQKEVARIHRELYEKDLHDPDNHNGVITHLEPDILECEVKWALGSITTNKASRWWNSSWAISNPERWCCESAALNMPENLENSSGHRTGKGQFSFQSQRKAMPKNALTTAQLHSSHALVKQYSKFSKPGFSNTWTVNFQMFKLVLEKAEEPEIKLPTSTESSKKQGSSRKTSTSALLTMPKPLTVDHNTVENS